MDFENATLAQLGRWMTARTGDMRPARVAQSSAPQLRYDWIVDVILRDPAMRAQFTEGEIRALADRVSDPTKRRAILDAAGLLPVPEGVNDGPH